MKLYPGATYSPTTNAANQPLMLVRDYICEHTMVAPFASVDNVWHGSTYSGSFAHFMVRGDGFVKQTQDLDRRAAANLNGNFNVISIENADMGETFPTWTGSNVPPFTDAQLKANIALLDWLCDEYDIPRTLVPNTKPGNRGIAYHRQGITGNYPDGLVAGGVRWSNATGKVCPGDNRIAQIKTSIIPALQEDPDMATLAELEARVVALEAYRVAHHNKLVDLEYGGNTANSPDGAVAGERPLTGRVKALEDEPDGTPGGTPNFAEIAANLHLEANG